MIEARNLTKQFAGKPSPAVDDLSFTVPPGVVTGFLGPNGAGKSTTMRLLLGLDRPNSGSALINGHPYDHSHNPMREVGALLDAKDINGARSARNHLLALAQSNGLPRRRVDEVLEIVGITSVAKHRIKSFSLGMSQRLGIACTLLGDPSVLLFDEPVNGLDPGGILWIRDFMRSLAAEGRTVFVSSHLMSEMALTADHLIVVGKGRLLADMPTQQLIEQSSTNHISVRSPQQAQLAEALVGEGVTLEAGATGQLQVRGLTCAQVGDVAAQHGFVIHELYEERASLEAAFMEMTSGSVEYDAGMAPPPPPPPSAGWAPPGPDGAAPPPPPSLQPTTSERSES